jgi:hypothetical protein
MPIRPLSRQGVSDPLLARNKCRPNKKGCGVQYYYDLYVDPSISGPIPDTTPEVLTDPTIWLSASDPGFSYADNTQMTTGWNDISGNVRHFNTNYGAGTYPIYRSNLSHPYVDFDDANKKIGRGTVPFTDFMGLTVGTVALIINQYHATQPNAVATHRPGDASNKWLQHLAFSDSNFYIDWGNQAGGGRASFAMPSGWRDGTFKVLIIRRNGNRLDVYQNGVSVYGNANAYTTGRTNTSDNLDLGGVSGFGWRLAEWITWNRSITDQEVIDLDTYLQTLKPV